MNKIFDFLIGVLLASMIVTSTISKEMFLSFHWVGIALGIALVLSSLRWDNERISKLEDEIKDLKNKLNNKEDKNYDTEY